MKALKKSCLGKIRNVTTRQKEKLKGELTEHRNKQK